MNTETTETIRGWVFYDAQCALCLGWAQRARGILARRHFALVPLQTPWVRKCLGLGDATALAEMRVRLDDGRIFGGADAVMELARRVWWTWPLWLASQLPGVMPVLRAGYRVIAKNRSCAQGKCRVGRRGVLLDFLPLVVLPIVVLCMQPALPPWVFMWSLALALFFGCKWLTWRRALAGGRNPSLARAVGYLLAWVGMDAEEFLGGKVPARPVMSAWTFAAVKALIGGALIWLAAANIINLTPMRRGWLGMVGVILFLHFGMCDLVALAWKRAGVNARPLMRAPLLAGSLADFWGARWNTAFHLLAHKLVFRPLARNLGAATAMLGVFLISGLVHDLLIWVPARGGYGLPTAYFIAQGLGVLCERSKAGRTLGLGRGARGWLFMFAVTVTPLFWLFHPIFVRNVILPMLDAIGTI